MRTLTYQTCRIFIGLALFVAASVAYASPVTYDFSLSGFVTYLGNLNDTPPYDPVTGTVTFDGTTLQNFSMSIGPTQYNMSNIVYTTGTVYADIGGAINGNGGPAPGTNDFYLILGIPYFLSNNLPYIPYLSPYDYTVASNHDLYQGDSASFSIAQATPPPSGNPSVPEPSSWLMMLAGLALLVPLYRRRRRKQDGMSL